MLVALSGKENSGKSTTIRWVRYVLLTGGWREIQYQRIGPNDFLSVLTDGRRHIGFISQGDWVRATAKFLQLRWFDPCEIVICACRPAPHGTHRMVAKRGSHRFLDKTLGTSRGARKWANVKDGHRLLELIFPDNLCLGFKKLATEVWDLLGMAHFAQYQLKEETLTDFVLLQLKARHPHQVFVQPFTRNQEGQNGADWEWWFQVGSQYVGFRVQAKVLHATQHKFHELHRHSKKHGSQNSLLIKQAMSSNPPLAPLYCLYLFTNNPRYLNRLPNTNVWRPFFGCSVISAYHVAKLRPKKQLKHLDFFLFPWHRLVCPPRTQSRGLLAWLDGLARGLLSATREEETEKLAPDSYITNRPPSYVRLLGEEGRISTITVDNQLWDRSLAGIALFRLSVG